MAEVRATGAAKAGVVVVRPAGNGTAEVLLVTARVRPGSWIFPMGTVEPGESAPQAAARECAEETGYRVTPGEEVARLSLNGQEVPFFLARVVGTLEDWEQDRQRVWLPPAELCRQVAGAFLPVAQAAVAWLAGK